MSTTPPASPAAVRHDPGAHRFTLATDAGPAVLAYEPDGDRVVFTHTVVPEPAKGRGVGSALVRGALAEARARGWAVVPRCPFVAAYLDAHPAERDVVAPT
jgi:predicted GNAT family acetyltransferase